MYTFVFVGRTTKYREQLVSNNCFTQCCFQFFYCKFFAFQVFHHDIVVCFSDSIDHHFATSFCYFLIFSRDISDFIFFTVIGFVNFRFHSHQVDDAFESIFRADWHLDSYGICTQTSFHHVNYVEEVSTYSIHLIYISDTRYAVVRSLTPYCFGLWFNAAFSTEYRNRTVKYT